MHKKSGGIQSQEEEMITLRLILVSGKTKDFNFALDKTACDITHEVFNNWPSEWVEEKVTSYDILRLIYHGRFLHGNVTLAALGLSPNKMTVMHLVSRESLPEPNLKDEEKKTKEQQRHLCCSLQ